MLIHRDRIRRIARLMAAGRNDRMRSHLLGRNDELRLVIEVVESTLSRCHDDGIDEQSA